ncbi:MAG: DUF3365 domain-containing protein [Campylobacterales bacterium]|nr:DUF3365 domain-containing protein [Campylobacterales bacterium]
MSAKKVKSGNDNFGLYGALSLMFFIIIFVVVMLFVKLEKNKQEFEGHLTGDILHNAIDNFDNIMLVRTWNASFGGLYVIAQEGMKPNEYLRDNVIHSDKNETLLRVNPAWMTRQLSEIANRDSNHYYKITSLKPINPINKPDTFEKEALEYFEKNKNESYYWRVKKSGDTIEKFDFMGSLKVVESCLLCHAEQGYKVGDIRGGIRVTVPTNDYSDGMSFIKKENNHMRWIVLISGLIIALLILFLMKKIFTHQNEIVELNEQLEKKVILRTQELAEINNSLEVRVANEVEKNRKKDEAMLTQSRYLAMGEILEMISHQWRQPITVIGVTAGSLLLNLELGRDNKDETKKELEHISAQTQKLSKIITDFSNLFESYEAQSFTEQCTLMNEVLNVMENSFKHYGIEVERKCESQSEHMLVSRELFQVYWNIINNAKEILIEREISNPKITIEIEGSENELITHVSDNAGGIKEEYMSKIFEPYFSTKEDLNGKGLGLYISKSIVEKHLHGSICVKNSDEGAIFTVRIPKKINELLG